MHLEKFSLKFSSLSFAIRVNLLDVPTTSKENASKIPPRKIDPASLLVTDIFGESG